MDANIRAAASLLRKASYGMQFRIRELRSNEQNIQHHVDDEERQIRRRLMETGAEMAANNSANNSNQYLVRRGYDLYKRSRQIKEEAEKKVKSDENEIWSLQKQSRKLDELARTLEMWS